MALSEHGFLVTFFLPFPMRTTSNPCIWQQMDAKFSNSTSGQESLDQGHEALQKHVLYSTCSAEGPREGSWAMAAGDMIAPWNHLHFFPAPGTLGSVLQKVPLHQKPLQGRPYSVSAITRGSALLGHICSPNEREALTAWARP